MKKIIAVILIIVGLIIVYFAVRHFTNRPTNTVTPVAQTMTLPDAWKQVTATAGTTQKFEKTVTSGLQPEIALVETTSNDATNSAKYTNNLIAGAKSALPSLRIISDETNSAPALYTRFLSGYYYNQKNKVNLLQRIYIQQTHVSVLTASFDDKSATAAEINSIFDLIWSQHPAN
jgi:hypothetical protein